MENHSQTNPFSNLSSRPDAIAAFLGAFGLIALLFYFQSIWIMAGLLIFILGAVAFWWGFEYIPLVVFLQLAFSVELQVASTTRLTVPTEILIPVLFFAFGLSVLFSGRITYRSSPLNVMVILMYCVMVASLRYSLEPISTIKAIVRDTGYIGAGYFLIPRYIRSEKHLYHLLIGCLGVHTLLVFYGFATQVLGGFHIYGKIASPFFVEHCIYAGYITITFAYLLAFYLSAESNRIRFWLGVACTIFGAAIVLTFVRAAWISVFFLLLFYLFQFRHKKTAVDLILVMIVATLLGIAIALTTDVGSLIMERFNTITETKYTANLDRIDRWSAAWSMWGDNPYLGVGWGSYPDQYFNYSPYRPGVFQGLESDVPYSAHFRMGAHNIYLEHLAEVGIVGLIVYLLMMYVFFRSALLLQYKINNPLYRMVLIGSQGAIITYLIHAFVNNLGPSDKIGITFWFIMGLIPTIEALHKSEEKQKAADGEE